MVETRNESIGGFYPGAVGGYGGGYGHDGILGIIALLALFRGNLFGGNHEGAGANLAEIQNQLSNIRADIGDVKYDNLSGTLQQTIGLLGEINAGRLENMSALLSQTNVLQGGLFGLQKDILVSANKTDMAIAQSTFGLSRQLDANAAAAAACCCETNLNLTKLGYENIIANLNQTNQLQRQMDANAAAAAACCCETNLNIERTAFATQLRDLENKCDTDRQLAEIKCLIKDTAKDQELARLTRAEEQAFIANQINKSISTTVGSWSAAAQFNGVTYPSPPFPFSGAF